MKLTLPRRIVVWALAVAALTLSAAQAQENRWTESYRLESLGKYAEAQKAVESLATQIPADEFATLRTAWLLYLQGRYGEAEQRYLAALAANPRSLEARGGVMLPRMAQYRWVEAIAAGQEALAESAWDYTAHTRIMACEEAMSQWDSLAKHAAELAARYPTDATPRVYWARAEAARRNIAHAKVLYYQVLERVPGHAEAGKFIKNNP